MTCLPYLTYSTGELLQRRIPQSLELVTGPASEPVTSAECKTHSKIDYTNEDSLISSWITQARQEVEQDASICLITQTWRLNLDWFPTYRIELFRRPIASVSSITYVDATGSTQTVSSSDYTTDLTAFPPRVEPAYGVVWPTNRQQPKAVVVTFVAGEASCTNEIAKQAIRLRVAMNMVDRTGADFETMDNAFNALVSKLKWGNIV